VIYVGSFLFNVLFNIWTALFSTGICLMAFLPRRRLQSMIVWWMGGIMWLLRLLCGIRYEVRGWENFPDAPAVLASKHQSTWDTGIFYVLCPDVAYVLKRELLWIPLYGWVLKRVKMIAVNRDAGASAMKSLIRQARDAIEDKRHVVIFPEGTRRLPGAPPDYQPGVAALYRAAGDLPTVPVALNSGVFWPRRSFVKQPGKIVIEFLPAIPPGLGREEFMKVLEERIETATNRLVAEAEAKS
jgi:1-acyl-sn-glycerol-3-phosphate acyltransferase